MLHFAALQAKLLLGPLFQVPSHDLMLIALTLQTPTCSGSCLLQQILRNTCSSLAQVACRSHQCPTKL